MIAKITALGAGMLCASVLAFAQDAQAAEGFKGSWTLTSSDQPGMVRFGLIHRMHGGHSHHESDWPVNAFAGLDVTSRGKRDAQFSVTRDAGRFDCEGYLNDSDGAGIFRFTRNAEYAKQMSALGLGGIDDDKQFSMAVTDVTVEFARQMKRENLIGLDTDKLIAFRIFNVDSTFIRELRAEGLPANETDKLIAFRVHGMTPAIVRAVRKAGIKVSEDQLIAFRVHGVSPEFIEKVAALGYQDLKPDQLVAMRVHRVTPEFIAGLRSRGMKDLTIDKMISLRVHGID